MKAKNIVMSFETNESVREKNSQVEELAVSITKLITEKGLNYRQAMAVLELVQAEIKECSLSY